MFVVDGGDGLVGIGAAPDLGAGLHIKTADSSASAYGDSDELVIENGTSGAGVGINMLSATNGEARITFGDSDDNNIGQIFYNHGSDYMSFISGATEIARLESDTGSSNTGGLKIGTTASNDGGLVVEKDEDGWFMFNLRNTSDTTNDTHMAYWQFINVAHDNTTDDFLRCKDSGTERATLTCDGDWFNHDNAYGAYSDERIKQDIRDSNSQWDDIKALRVRNFKKKDDVRQYGENAWEQIGLIAQEVEASGMDKLIRRNKVGACDVLSSSEFGTLYTEQDEIDGLIPTNYGVGDVKTETDQVKSILYSVVQMKALKALQEAMEKIETLEAKVAVLEG